MYILKTLIKKYRCIVLRFPHLYSISNPPINPVLIFLIDNAAGAERKMDSLPPYFLCPFGVFGALIRVKASSNVMARWGQRTVTWHYVRVLLHLTKGKTENCRLLGSFPFSFVARGAGAGAHFPPRAIEHVLHITWKMPWIVCGLQMAVLDTTFLVGIFISIYFNY